MMQILAPYITSSCKYSSFLTRVADADADHKRFPWVKLHQTYNAHAHVVTEDNVAMATIGVDRVFSNKDRHDNKLPSATITSTMMTVNLENSDRRIANVQHGS
jgi:hypothetical protein